MQQLARRVHYADGRPGMAKSPIVSSLISPRSEPLNASLSGVLDKRGPPMLTRAWLAILLSRVVTAHDQSRGMAIEHSRDFEVIAASGFE
jgi:hypothetical protein